MSEIKMMMQSSQQSADDAPTGRTSKLKAV
jgi:hypothetical protein